MNSSLPGVTLLDLQLAVNCTLDEATLLMPTNAAGFMVGALICGVIIEFIDFQIVLLISTVACSATTAYFPLNRKFWILCLNSSVNGFLTGFMISGGNAWLLHLWGKASPPFLQAFHFCFGLGAFIGPLVAEPFLLPLHHEEIEIHVGVTLVGFGTSPLFATIFSFLGEYMKITSKVSSLLFVACYAGAFVMPYVVGVTVETHPDVFLYQSALCAVSLCLVFFGLFFIKRAQLLDKCEEENNNVELRNKHIADAQP
ncbi:uncharacterized protein B4U79_19080 [Dinothrombium tinctorium]|uniref:Sodium-dependent glucose transporter 1-like protein n=1 Tax=Dinothrombium tinctorium TaxID=1965070 RepID=A0A3S3NTF2_9ACAR|nr:uncharacterized protein B4U79_19080 [Dinothrombium tinctorium]